MKILIICATDRSKHFISLNIIKYLVKLNIDNLSIYVLDKNKSITSYLKKKRNKVKHIKNKINFYNSIKKNEYDWLLNIWGYKIFKKDFLSKFKKNLNLHPSFLPYNKGRDPYYFSIINQTPIGITIHEMDEKIDNGKYYIREKFNFDFPFTAGDIFDISLKNIKSLFIKNWIKIRNGKIKLKKFSNKVHKTNKRIDLIHKNFLNLDDKKNSKIKNFILNCLGQDFPFLKQQVKIFNKIYDCKIILKNNNKKIW
jgi:methionyl-tRNA formyltransferase